MDVGWQGFVGRKTRLRYFIVADSPLKDGGSKELAPGKLLHCHAWVWNIGKLAGLASSVPVMKDSLRIVTPFFGIFLNLSAPSNKRVFSPTQIGPIGSFKGIYDGIATLENRDRFEAESQMRC